MDARTQEERILEIQAISQILEENLEKARKAQARVYDRRQLEKEFEVGQLVRVFGTHMRTQRPSRKLNTRRLGPFKILERIGKVA